MYQNLICNLIQFNNILSSEMLNNQQLIIQIQNITNEIISSIQSGGKILSCGNGGSASDSMHFITELVGRFSIERNPIAAISLNSNATLITALANDYGYDFIFTRQIRGIMVQKDILVVFSTSGNSSNIVNAVKEAKTLGGKSAGFLGKDGGQLINLVDYPILIPSYSVPRIQEMHIMCVHIICELVELVISKSFGSYRGQNI